MAGESLIGNLAVLLTMETAAFEKGTSQATKLLRRTQRDFEAVATKVVGIGKTMSLAITTPLVGFGAVAIKEATEAQAAMAQVNAALTSMGPVAGRTAEQLKAASDALEMKSLFEGDEILRKVTANLLTFGNISGQAFDRAQQAAVNLSARLGQDLQASTIQVGKALNDPIKGMTALSRVGVQFSESQKETIKTLVETGQTAKAQGIILGELERQFGGAAEAAQNADPFNKANDAFKQMAETVGNALLPIIPVFTEAVVTIAKAFSDLSPQTQKFLIIAGGIAAVLGPIAVVFGTLISVTGTLLPLIIKIGPAFRILLTVLTGLGPILTAVRVAMFALLSNPVILGAAALIAGIYLAWKNWDKIVEIVSRVYNGVKTYIMDKLKAVFDWVVGKLQWVGDKFKWLYDVVVGHSYIPDMVDEIGKHMARLDQNLVQPATSATSKAAQAFQDLQQRVQGILQRLFPEQAAQIQFNKDLQDLEEFARKAGMGVDELADAVNRLRAEYTGFPENPLPSADLLSAGDNPDRMEADTDRMLSMLTAIPQAAKTANDALARIASNGLRTLGDGLTAVIMGTAKLKDVFHTVAEQILADLLRLAIQKYIIGSIMKAVGITGFADGGPVPGFAYGGFVSGPGGPRSDRVPAMLSNGEFVVNAASTKKFLPLLEKINSGALRFATGGPVRFAPERMSSRGIANDNSGAMPKMEFVFHNDFRGADSASVAAIQARQDRFEAELPGRVVRTMNDARERFVWRDKR